MGKGIQRKKRESQIPSI